jgi:2-hydroxy-3-oxopropionate reductase
MAAMMLLGAPHADVRGLPRRDDVVTSAPRDLGFVGLGIMGRPMAANLIAAGHRLHLQSRSGVPPALIEAGGDPCADAAEVARRSEVVFTMVPATADVERVLFGSGGIAEGLSPGKAVVDTSSISPAGTRTFAARVQALGCDYVDAPVSGGEAGARDATLSMMAGATDAAFARVNPLLALLGKTVTHVGPVGAGQTAKVANQIVVALAIQGVAEALLFAARAGVDPERVRQALLGGFAGSRVLEVHGARMTARQFTPGGRIELHRKDLALALGAARDLGVALPCTANAHALFDACVAHGDGGLDQSALVTALELLAGAPLAR